MCSLCFGFTQTYYFYFKIKLKSDFRFGYANSIILTLTKDMQRLRKIFQTQANHINMYSSIQIFNNQLPRIGTKNKFSIMGWFLKISHSLYITYENKQKNHMIIDTYIYLLIQIFDSQYPRMRVESESFNLGWVGFSK